jgi:hypothetical protein
VQRTRARLTTLFLLLGLSACSGDDEKRALPVLLEVVAHRLDGEPPTQGLQVQKVGSTSLGPPIALVAVPGRPHVYEVPGAGAGRYGLTLPGGWGMLSVSGQPPFLQPDGRPTRVNVGRPHTMYCTAMSIDRPLGEVWGARRVDPSGALGAALHLEVQADDKGWILLRFKPEEWAGPMALQGRFADGRLTELVLTKPGVGGRPILRQLNAEPTAPLRVTVVGGEAGGAGVWVRARVLGLPLDEVQERPVRDGVAEFEGIATSKEGLEIEVQAGPERATYRLATDAWARLGEVRLLAPLPGRTRAIVSGVSPADLVRVQLRRGDESSYGWVPHASDANAAWVEAAPGTWRVLVETKHGFAQSEVTVEGNLTMSTAVTELGTATVVGTLRGATEARLVWERQERGRGVLAHGFVVVVRGGAFEVTLPAGTYRLFVENASGVRGAPQEFALMPGQRVSATLDAPPEK